MDPDMGIAYLDFVRARHSVWEQRQAGTPAPWAEDPILQQRKFTNVYRVLDPGSQFVLTDLGADNPDPTDALTRALLYRFTNRPEAWRAMAADLGQYPTYADLEDGTLAELWADMLASGTQMFSGAYIVMPDPGGKVTPGVPKVQAVVALAQRVLVRGTTRAQVLSSKSLPERLALLMGHHGMGGFMAQQVLTDYGYLYGPDLENTHVVDGPGSRRGAKALAPGWSFNRTIGWAAAQLHSTRLLLPSGGYRSPSLMDTQNTLCEFSKYVRFMGQPQDRKTYTPAHPGPQPKPVLPSHWY